ncbi:hypothetical protein COC69_12415 [Bacillus cereus]|uniref:Uncharacterized protein n=1 Tax=Bacillus cereus TaxID=1396 RepID=A0A9X7CNQ6_BACCE|nr:hypothetical protein COC69_12415 [Bacillus cereus]
MFFVGGIIISSFLVLKTVVSAVKTQLQYVREYNEIKITLNSHTWFMLIGRSVNVISGDISAVVLNKIHKTWYI